MDDFEAPEDLTRLDETELAGLLEGALAAYQVRADSDTITQSDLSEMRQLANAAKSIRGEQASRRTAAEEAAAEIDAMSAELGIANEDPADADGDGETSGGGQDGGDAAAAATTAPPAPALQGEIIDNHPDAAANSAQVVAADRPLSRRPALNLAGVRKRQPRVLPQAGPPLPEISASVDVPGYAPGQPLDLEGVSEGFIRRATALRTAGGGVGLVSSYRLPFPEPLIITDATAGTEGSRAVMHAADQTRLPRGDLVASGGWCAPSETIYTLTNISCPEMLWDAPEIQLARGGLRFFRAPSLDVSTMTWVHTEQDDISGAEKPCFMIPCPEPEEVRCDAVGICIQAGILTQRHFPELIDYYRNLIMVAHEMRIRQHLLDQVTQQATDVAIAPTFGALSALYAAVALQVSDMTERHSLCNNINIEVVFPWWARAMMLADLARQNGRRLDEVRVQQVVDLFATLGVSIQWARGIGPAVPDAIGGATPATDWPAEVCFLMYPAGSVQIGRGGEVSLGVIHESNRFAVNDYTAAFSEECVAAVIRVDDIRRVCVPLCPSGQTADQIGITCPAGDQSPGESPGSP